MSVIVYFFRFFAYCKWFRSKTMGDTQKLQSYSGLSIDKGYKGHFFTGGAYSFDDAVQKQGFSVQIMFVEYGTLVRELKGKATFIRNILVCMSPR